MHVLHPRDAQDWDTARDLLAGESALHPYSERPVELLDAAAGGSAEYHAAVAVGESGGVIGAIVYGLVAGAEGAGALYGIAVASPERRCGVGRSLVEYAADHLRALGGRFALAEVPDDDAAVAPVRALLGSAGFAEEARVADFYRDGVALVFMRREVGSL